MTHVMGRSLVSDLALTYSDSVVASKTEPLRERGSTCDAEKGRRNGRKGRCR